MGVRLNEILSRKASPVVYYYQDIRGSIRGLTGSDSKPIQAYEYTAFGERHVSSRSKQFLLLDKLIDQPYGFTGRPKEELTGLYYYRYRDYNPQTGRFLQPDPLGQLPGPNIYSYCQNNPVNWVDPWGMECENREESYDDFWSRWPDYVTDPEWVWDNIVEPIYNTLSQPGYNYGEWVYGEQNLNTFYGACLDSAWAVSVIYGTILDMAATNSTYYRYVGSESNPTYGVNGNVADGTWLNRNPYYNMDEAMDAYSAPVQWERVERVEVNWWSDYIGGPRPSAPQNFNGSYTSGGGVEYRVGGFGDWGQYISDWINNGQW